MSRCPFVCAQRTRLVEVAEDVLDNQLRRLLSYKQSFPSGRPQGALQDAIGYIGFALSVDLLRDSYVRAYPGVEELVLECTRVWPTLATWMVSVTEH